jgi:hypothetical protein
LTTRRRSAFNRVGDLVEGGGPMSEGGPDQKPPNDINLLWLLLLGGLFFLFVLLAGLMGLTP